MRKSKFRIENIFVLTSNATSSRIKITYLERLIALDIWQM